MTETASNTADPRVDEWRAYVAADPRVAAWRAIVAADRPPLTPAQIAILRPICAQMLPHMKGAQAERAKRSEVSGPIADDPPG